MAALRNGSRATAESAPVDLAPGLWVPPSVTGRLEVTNVQFGDLEWNVCLIYVLDLDGNEVPIEVVEDTIAPAATGEGTTVLPERSAYTDAEWRAIKLRQLA